MKAKRGLLKVEGRREVEEKGRARGIGGGSSCSVSQSPVSGELPPVVDSVPVPEEGLHQRAESVEGPHTDGQEGPHHQDCKLYRLAIGSAIEENKILSTASLPVYT